MLESKSDGSAYPLFQLGTQREVVFKACTGANDEDDSLSEHELPSRNRATYHPDNTKFAAAEVAAAPEFNSELYSGQPSPSLAQGHRPGLRVSAGAHHCFETAESTMLQNSDETYTVELLDDSMEPACRRGDLFIVDPRLEIRLGDDVVATLKDDSRVLARLVELDNAVVSVRQFNPGKVLKFERNELLGLHATTWRNLAGSPATIAHGSKSAT